MIKNITTRQMIDFVWGNVICRFRVPWVLIFDNEIQFDCKDFNKFIENLGIHHKFVLVTHPWTNGQTKVTNRTILNGLI